MDESILALLNKAGKFSEEDSLLLKQELNFRELKKGDFLLEKGNVCSSLCFVISGSFYQYNIDSELNRNIIDINIENDWVSQCAKIQLSGASRFLGEISVNDLELDMRGASTADLFGKIHLLTTELSGVSEIRDYDLEVERLDIKLSGVGEAFVSVNESIDIEGSGKSVLHYKGNAFITYKRLSGDASIKNRN
ncbi:GIN domain-containing protein [Fulvivirga lutimaris]|uniref:GIN domain-containing protein n=1 Tax=Fulvivirga lutimaris TaxID=1819566 RepID=UPI0012BB64AD|nr:DUF2807 domain-containing protein [Fulvivirga lutimaris]MTI38567.1 hypothetical protein [Fulvivirga lutimaris]